MIRVFDKSQSAIFFALEFNQSHDEAMAMLQEGISHWVNDHQVLLFPVLLLAKLPVMECFELFHHDLGYECSEIEIVKKALGAICSEYPDCRILTIGRWSMEIWIPSINGKAPRVLVDRLEFSNREIAESLGRRWGRMGAVSPQPNHFYREKQVFKLGVQ